MTDYSFSELLYARPSFFSGMARILDLGTTFDTYNTSENTNMADYNALKSDWIAVGIDLKNSIKENQHGE
jgi:hypothetical protein